MSEIELMEQKLKSLDQGLNILSFELQNIIFEERVHLKCFYCAKYNKKWTCPPRLPDLDYKKIILEYKKSAIISCCLYAEESYYEEIREKSTNILHRALLSLEKVLWETNNPLVLSFIGGSCKLCKNGCDENMCKNPSLKRIPLEATGINVVQSLKNVNINIDFTEKNCIHRYGLILW